MKTQLAPLLWVTALSTPIGQNPTYGAIPISGPVIHAENWDVLAVIADSTPIVWSDDSSIDGWWVHRANAGTPGVGGRLAGESLTYYGADGSTAPNGTPNLHGPLNLGANGGEDRTLGASPTTALGEISLVSIFENTGQELLELASIDYVIKVFRSNSSAAETETIALTWKIGSSQTALLEELDSSGAVGQLGATPDLGYATVNPSLDHTHVTTSPSEHHVPPLSENKSGAPVSQIRLLPGEFLALRWGNVNDSGTDAMIGIDDISVSFASPAAVLLGNVSGLNRDPNGSPGDPSDDQITFSVSAVGFGAVSPSGWKIASPAPFAGRAVFPYDSGTASFAAVALSDLGPGASTTLRLEDAEDPSVYDLVTVAAPLAPPHVTTTRSQSINFTEAAPGSSSYDRVEGGSDLSWSASSQSAAVRVQPPPGPQSSKYFDLNNTRGSLVSEPVYLAEAPAFTVSLKLATYTTSTTGFEAPDTVSAVVETSVTGDFTDARKVAWILDPVTTNGIDLFAAARVGDPGTNYGTVPYPSTPFPFVTRSIALPRGSATQARLRISGGNDSSSEHTLVDDIVFSYFDPDSRDDSDGDGLPDADELARTVDGLPAPTNPLDPDTDGDGLSDSVETGTGVFLSASDTGTDPLRTDSDEDGTRDATEVNSGTNPNDPDSGFIQFYATDEEFNGPFASWKNVKLDFGAIGDGIADDTAAIQSALDWFKDMPNTSASVLYFPAGIYRLTATLITTRVAHHDYLGFEMVGENPATTGFLWDGQTGETMIQLDQWYGKVSRLSFDGARRAGKGLYREGAFSTYSEISDCWFRDLGRGIQFGGRLNGQAETFVNRCRFARISENAILVTNFNSLDIWVWNSLFYDCATGLYCAAGNFHSFKNVFLRSSNSDILGSSFVYDLTQNVSVGSNRFANWQTGFIDPLSINILMRGNRIYDFTGTHAIFCNQVGPYLYLDNIIKNREGDLTSSLYPGGNALLVGNRYSVPGAVDPSPVAQAPDGIVRELDAIVDPGLETPASVDLPRTPPQVQRTIFEVPPGTGDDAASLQAAINGAASSAAPHPVVHIAKGNWSLARTVYVPPHRELQIIGDGGSENGTSLSGSGPPRYLLRLRGPSRATIRDLNVGSLGIVIEDASQLGGRIYAEQLNTTSGSNGLVLEAVEDSDVTFLAASVGPVAVSGGPKLSAGLSTSGQVSIFGGAGNNPSPAYSVKNGGRLLSEAVYHELSDSSRLNAIDLTPSSSGSLTVAMAKFAYPSSPTIPLVRSTDWRGQLALIGNFYVVPGGEFNDQAHWLALTGDGSQMQSLVLGGAFSTLPPSGAPLTQTDFIFRDTTAPDADAGIYLAYTANDSNGNSYRLDQRFRKSAEAPDDDYLRSMLAMLREARIDGPSSSPPGATDVKLYRVISSFRAIGSIDEKELAASQSQVIRFTEPDIGATSFVRTSADGIELGWECGASSASVRRQPAPGPIENRYFDINGARVQFTSEAIDISAVSSLTASIGLSAYTTSNTGYEADDRVTVILETSFSGDFDDTVEAARLIDGDAIDGIQLFDLLRVSDPGTGLGGTTPFPAEAFPSVQYSATIPRNSARFARLRIVGGNNSSSEHLIIDDIVFSDASPQNLDSDNDGLPDAWELSYFDNLDLQTGSGDADLDGAPNEAEFVAGTNPADPSSRLTLELLNVAPESTTLLWSSVPGKSYQIEMSESPDPAGTWTPTGGILQAADGTATSAAIGLSEFTGARIFFRVRVVN